MRRCDLLWQEATLRGWHVVLGTGSGELRHRPTGYWEELPFGAYLVGRAAARAIAVEQAWLQLSLWPSEIPPFVFRA